MKRDPKEFKLESNWDLNSKHTQQKQVLHEDEEEDPSVHNQSSIQALCRSQKQQTLPFNEIHILWDLWHLQGFTRGSSNAVHASSFKQHKTTRTANSPSRGPRTQRGDFLYLTAWAQVRTTAKWQIADCWFSSSSQSNKCDMKAKHTPSWAQGGREEEWQLSTCQQYRGDECTLPFQHSGVWAVRYCMLIIKCSLTNSSG